MFKDSIVEEADEESDEDEEIFEDALDQLWRVQISLLPRRFDVKTWLCIYTSTVF